MKRVVQFVVPQLRFCFDYLELESLNEVDDGVEKLFDLIVVLLQKIVVSVAFGQFVDEIFHDFVLLNKDRFFALFMLIAIIHINFPFVNRFFINYSLFLENMVHDFQSRHKINEKRKIYGWNH